MYLGDALEVLPVLAGEGLKADMVFTDPPYGTTHCRWDSMIDIPDMWQAVSLITMPDTPILLFCQQPFTSVLGSSNLKKLRMFSFSLLLQIILLRHIQISLHLQKDMIHLAVKSIPPQ